MIESARSFHSLPALQDPVALLVDGENLSAGLAEQLFREASKFGVPSVRRVYGKSERIKGWAASGFRLVPTRPGKNAADILLCIEAMNLALREGLKTLLIASSDGDFSYLAEHLRELGHQIIGLGETNTTPEFRLSCTQFVELPARVGLASAVSGPTEATRTTLETPAPKPKPSALPHTKISALDKRIHAHIQSHQKDGKPLTLVRLADLMKGEPVKKQTGFKCWRSYLAKSPLYELDAPGRDAKIRLVSR